MMTKYIEKPENGRRFVIADIHGCNRTLQTLVKDQLKFTKDDQLFFLGDYVSRGPDSLGVLKYLMELQARAYQVFPLRGNHEQMLLEKLQMRERLYDDMVHAGGKSLALQISVEQKKWLRMLPYYYTLDRFYLVHGAINTQAEKPLEDFEYMLWYRETKNPASFLAGKQLIHGHTIHELSEIEEAIRERHDCIPLDNGCYKACGGKQLLGEYGHLCALDLDNWKLYIQENID